MSATAEANSLENRVANASAAAPAANVTEEESIEQELIRTRQLLKEARVKIDEQAEEILVLTGANGDLEQQLNHFRDGFNRLEGTLLENKFNKVHAIELKNIRILRDSDKEKIGKMKQQIEEMEQARDVAARNAQNAKDILDDKVSLLEEEVRLLNIQVEDREALILIPINELEKLKKREKQQRAASGFTGRAATNMNKVHKSSAFSSTASSISDSAKSDSKTRIPRKRARHDENKAPSALPDANSDENLAAEEQTVPEKTLKASTPKL